MGKKIKVLHVAQAAGGVDRYLQMLLKYFDKNKFENILVCSQYFQKEDYEGIVSAFEQIEMTREISYKDLLVAHKIRKLIKKYKPDVVYAHSSKAGAVARIANFGLKTHCIYNPHGWAFNMQCSKKAQLLYVLVERVAAIFCDKIICISEAEKQSALNKKICREDKLCIICNGVDIEECETNLHNCVTRNDMKIPDCAFVFVMVGRISEQKAPDIFIRAAKLIKNKIPSAHFIIVGSGELEGKIRSYAENNDLAAVLHITGWVKNPFSYVGLFDVACLLSRWEGFGLVLPEYMIAKKPIVASNVDAIPYIVQDHENGLLVSPNDPVDVYRAVIELKENSGLKRLLIENGYQTVNNKFNIKRVALDTEELIEKIIS